MYKRTSITAILPYVLVCALSLKLISPLFQPGFFQAHDAFGHIYHMIEINECIRHGILYPRWLPDMYWSRGGPIMTFYPPFFYYSALPFYWLTQSYFAGLKISIGLGIILSGVFMYILARKYWGVAGALLAAAAYIYAPYHIVDIYVRGAFPESCLYVFLPAGFLLTYKAVTTSKKAWTALLALALGISFITHVMSLFLPLVLIPYALLTAGRRNWRRASPLAAGFALALGLTAFYWLPAALQMTFMHISRIAPGQYNWRDHFVYPLQLVSTAWGWGDSLPGTSDGMSFQVGIAHLAFIVFSIAAIPVLPHGRRKIAVFFLAMGLLSIFMTLPCSSPLWSNIPCLGIIQFPWRLLLFANFFTSLLAGATLCILRPERKNARWVATTLGIILILALYGRYCRAVYPNTTFPTDAECTRSTIIEKALGKHELQYLPRWVKQLPERVPENKVTLKGEGIIEALKTAPDKLSFSYSAPEETRCSVNTFYYPCWICSIDGTAHPVQPGEPEGEIIVRLPPGEHEVTLRYTNPPSVILAQLISLVSVIAAVALILWKGKRKWIYF
ncbi:MAG: hypothetical protein P9M00_02910 [Candidatus Tritonobacter lacicola]|nr:hypothetical protein [Candidatus Tritonobacter lacicola]